MTYYELLKIHNECLEYYNGSCDVRCPFSRYDNVFDYMENNTSGCACVFGTEYLKPANWVLPESEIIDAVSNEDIYGDDC